MIQADLTTAYKSLDAAVVSPLSLKELAKVVVDEPFKSAPLVMAELFLGFMCLYVLDPDGKELRLLAASDTEYYELGVKDYPAFDPDNFSLSMNDTNNDLVKAVISGRPVHTADWSSVRRPEAAAEIVRLNQASSGIATAYNYPLTSKRRGVMMYNFFQYVDGIGEDQTNFMEHYTKQVSEYLDAQPATVAA
jgi:hypothetical protein